MLGLFQITQDNYLSLTHCPFCFAPTTVARDQCIIAFECGTKIGPWIFGHEKPNFQQDKDCVKSSKPINQ
jgi:hypothetical protein